MTPLERDSMRRDLWLQALSEQRRMESKRDRCARIAAEASDNGDLRRAESWLDRAADYEMEVVRLADATKEARAHYVEHRVAMGWPV